MRKLNRLIISTLVGCIFLINNASLCDDRKVILKDYGELKYNRTKSGNYCHDEDKGNPKGRISACEITYLNKLGIGEDGASIYQTIFISISTFINDDYSLNEFLFRNIKIYQIVAQAGENIIKIDKSTKRHNAHDYYWVSNDNLIWFSIENIDVLPDIMKDYQAKYPPTHVFIKGDFDVDNLLRKEIMLKLELIERLDDSRDSFDDMSADSAAGNQCQLEMDVRCWTGMTAGKWVFCPIAVNGDDSERKRDWKKF